MSTPAADLYRRHRFTAEEYHRMGEASLRYDREIKIPVYARHGIPALWLVDLTGRELTVWQQPAGDGYLQTRVVTELAAVALPGLSDLAVDLTGLSDPRSRQECRSSAHAASRIPA